MEPNCENKSIYILHSNDGCIVRVKGTCIHHGMYDGEIMVKDGDKVCAILSPVGIVCREDFKQAEC